MTTQETKVTREVEHGIDVDVPADAVYRMIAEVENWPLIFPPTVLVEHVERGEHDERIRIWATANGEPKDWTSRRTLDPVRRVITFRQERSAAPVAAMGGAWVIEPRGAAGSRVRLLHDYRAVDDDPESLAWIDQAVDRNSRSELAALKRNVEQAAEAAELTLSFVDSVPVEGTAKDLYDFVNEAGKWRERLPHVAAVDLRETTPGLQVLRMDTLTKDGEQHTTESVRVCFSGHRIVYKQTTLPALMDLHTGRWDFTEDGQGTTTASSQHTVVVNRDNIAAVLGEQATVQDALRFLREALGANSRATLGHAKAYAEARR
ncbi:aromatase/cyclase [Actinokineospora sp. PR83]|uniref:aromatase/cyclase n=1 Tax=Actinokineospora sp. PR83 TaxID=2884908 RepID=UPI001F398D07|nr:aromatase/cyclase [Actinokineospora sp. PR83]MCG8916941.1 aromatase/cyclase [Actinokineospora sp. PR83]